MTPETKIKKLVKKYLSESTRWYTAISDRYTSGLPDFFALTGIKPLFIEVKAIKGRMSGKQWSVAKQIMAAGGIYKIATVTKEGKLVLMDMSEPASQALWVPSVTRLAKKLYSEDSEDEHV